MKRLLVAIGVWLTCFAAHAQEACETAPEVGVWRGSQIPDIRTIVVRQPRPCQSRNLELELWGPCGRSASCFLGVREVKVSGVWNPNLVHRRFGPTELFKPRSNWEIYPEFYIDRSGKYVDQEVMRLFGFMTIDRRRTRFGSPDHIRFDSPMFRWRAPIDLAHVDRHERGKHWEGVEPSLDIVLTSDMLLGTREARYCSGRCVSNPGCLAWSYRGPTPQEPAVRRCRLFTHKTSLRNDPAAISGSLR